jgi:uncharacterized protein
MTKEIWLNLPAKDVKRSQEFFTKLGYSFNEYGGLVIGSKKFVIMLFAEPAFKSFTRTEIADTSRASEILISIDAESREEVDEIARKAEAAGGVIFARPAEGQGRMYGCGFADIDGHRWNVLYMGK